MFLFLNCFVKYHIYNEGKRHLFGFQILFSNFQFTGFQNQYIDTEWDT